MEEIAKQVEGMCYDDLKKIRTIAKRRMKEFEDQPFDYPSLPREVREAIVDQLDGTTAANLARSGRVGYEDTQRVLWEERKAMLASLVAISYHSEKNDAIRVLGPLNEREMICCKVFPEITLSEGRDGTHDIYGRFETVASFLDFVLEDLADLVFVFMGRENRTERMEVSRPTFRTVMDIVKRCIWKKNSLVSQEIVEHSRKSITFSASVW